MRHQTNKNTRTMNYQVCEIKNYLIPSILLDLTNEGVSTEFTANNIILNKALPKWLKVEILKAIKASKKFS